MAQREKSKKKTFIVVIPVEIEAENPHDAYMKVHASLPAGCVVTGHSVSDKNQLSGMMMAPRR